MIEKAIRFSRSTSIALTICAVCLMLGAVPAQASPADSPTGEWSHDIEIPSPDMVGPDVFWTGPAAFSSPPDDPEVGDSWLWWLWVHQPMPPHFEQFQCTVRGKSDRGYVVVRDSDWLVSMDQADVDVILERWENSSIGPYPDQGIYEIDSTAFGAPPDELDDDIRIYQVWFDFNMSADGFFFWFDQYPDGTYPAYHSNECEVVYLNTTSSGGPSGEYMLAVIAHEFQHMIHWLYDDNESSWVNEGLSELAMWLYGNPDNISSFNSNPDNSLVEWDGNWADYIKTYLWTLYFYENYGGHPSILALVNESANSIAGYDAVLDQFGYSQDFEDVFADWVVANFLNDTTISDGRFGYVGDDLPPFNTAGTYSTYPLTDVYKTVNYWAADYYRFQELDTYDNLLLSFDGSDNNSYAVWVFVLPETGDTEVLRMPINEAEQTGQVYVSDLDEDDDQVVMAVAGISSSGTKGYYFSAEASTGIAVEEPSPLPLSITASPNPFVGAISIRMSWTDGLPGDGTSIEIYDLQGRLVRTLTETLQSNDETVMLWDGTDDRGLHSGTGVYFARVISGDGTGGQTLKLLCI